MSNNFYYPQIKSGLEMAVGSTALEASRKRVEAIRETFDQQKRQDIPTIQAPQVSPEEIVGQIKLFNERVLAKQDMTNKLLARQFNDNKTGELVELFDV